MQLRDKNEEMGFPSLPKQVKAFRTRVVVICALLIRRSASGPLSAATRANAMCGRDDQNPF